MKHGDVISYLKMCMKEGVNLQKGMNYHLKGRSNVILMSLRSGAPYADRVEEDGRILIYEGHDVPQQKGSLDSKTVVQEIRNPGGTLTENGLFFESAMKYKQSKSEPELVKVYEKIRSGICTRKREVCHLADVRRNDQDVAWIS